jgi:uncharacterized protein (DUF1330 family)
MPAYVIADIDVHDPDAYKEYAAQVQATLEPFEGRYLVRGGASEALEGAWEPRRLVVIQFPSAEHARGWYTSQDYGTVIGIRHRSATGSIILAHGVDS